MDEETNVLNITAYSLTVFLVPALSFQLLKEKEIERTLIKKGYLEYRFVERDVGENDETEEKEFVIIREENGVVLAVEEPENTEKGYGNKILLRHPTMDLKEQKKLLTKVCKDLFEVIDKKKGPELHILESKVQASIENGTKLHELLKKSKFSREKNVLSSFKGLKLVNAMFVLINKDDESEKTRFQVKYLNREAYNNGNYTLAIESNDLLDLKPLVENLVNYISE
jgi:hypothetical protein